DHYHGRWKELNQYVHPSAYLAGRMLGESALHMIDAFDEEWALDTFAAATDVFDLVWLAVLTFPPLAAAAVAKAGLLGRYPILSPVLEAMNTSTEATGGP